MSLTPCIGPPAPPPEPAPTLVLPGYSPFVLWAQHSSHVAFGLQRHMRPTPNISIETKDHRQTFPLRHIACSVRRTYWPPPPPPRVDNVSWSALQPPCTPSQPQHGPWQPQPPDACP